MKKQLNKKRIRAIVKSGVFVAAAFLPYTAQAIILEVPIGNTNTADDLLGYITVFYQFMVSAIVFAAIVMIMFAGLKWASAAGNASMISDAKERIKGAIMGLSIALASYMILFLINPYLVTFQDISVENLEFDSAYTTSLSVMSSGNICEDENLVKYLEELPEDLARHLHNYAGLPCIQKSIYEPLVSVLTAIDNAHLTDPYHGMKLVINGANRSYSSQKHFYDCYKQYGEVGKACPDECRASNCSVAANPGDSEDAFKRSSTHGRGLALDVSSDWIGAKASSSYHNKCVVNGGTASGCDTTTYNNIVILDELMQSHGFERICIEWWHFQAPGGSHTCAAGTYR